MKRTILASTMIAAAGVAAALDVWAHAGHALPGTSDVTFAEPTVYGLASPSYWPLSPYPAGTPRTVQPTPTHTLAHPCPTWAPTLIWHDDGHGGGYYECLAYIPPDPGGPVLASPSPTVK